MIPEIHARIVRGALAVTLGAMLAAACPAAAQMRLISGSYVGDGTPNHAIIDLGFQPDLVIVKGRGATSAVARSASMSGDAAKELGAPTRLKGGLIRSL